MNTLSAHDGAGRQSPPLSSLNPLDADDCRKVMGLYSRSLAELDQLQKIQTDRRCPRNPSLKVEHCSACQTKEPGHSQDEVRARITELKVLTDEYRRFLKSE